MIEVDERSRQTKRRETLQEELASKKSAAEKKEVGLEHILRHGLNDSQSPFVISIRSSPL